MLAGGRSGSSRHAHKLRLSRAEHKAEAYPAAQQPEADAGRRG